MFYSILCCCLLLVRVQGYGLYVNCTFENVFGSDCENLIRDAIISYTENSYHKNTIPRQDIKNPLNVTSYLTFNSLTTIDQVSGTVEAAVYFDILWYDEFIYWDSKWTDGIDSLYIPSDLVWTPDILLINAVSDFTKMLQTTEIYLESDGYMWWGRPGLIAFSCDFSLTDFPFDKQTCSPIFGSYKYSQSYIRLYFDTPPFVVSSSFVSSEWNVDDISASRIEKDIQFYGIYDYLIWDLHITRYTSFYISSAIVPEVTVPISNFLFCVSLLAQLLSFFTKVTVTAITLLALWISDINSRLGLAVTGLLTVVAVQWTVSASLPITNETTWLAVFSNVCIIFVALVCAGRLSIFLSPHFDNL